jgi:NADPH-dependent 2,4-dienoyl-CoA reductase/sulfur reductase-like enzyme/ferredoxin
MNSNTSAAAPAGTATNASEPNRFPNYLQLPTLLPLSVWMILRWACVAIAIGVATLLFLNPKMGLTLFWMVLVPVLPAVFIVAPGVWRNVCPMAALNQTPRLLGFTRGLSHTPVVREYSYVVGIALFFILVSSRKWLFDTSGMASGLLILFGLLGAFLGGLVFKGKSGWCSSICPMLPVQRVYGQTPLLFVGNAHCRPCVGCSKNCFDFNPGVAYLADQYDSDKHYAGYRRVFVGILPGFILAFFSVPTGSEAATVVAAVLVAGGLSLAIFHVLETFLKLPANRLTVVFGALAFSVYYWSASATWFKGLSLLSGSWEVPQSAVWSIRVAVVVLALHWIWRSFRTENQFVAQTAQRTVSQPVKLGQHAAAAFKAVGDASQASLVIEPDDKTVPAKAGQSLLELVESCGGKIEAGCRMGVCGADPVAVHEGAEFLTPIEADERNTLERLGHASNTRLACSARLQKGCVHIALVPDKALPLAASAGQSFDRSIKNVVVIGNGIAGVTVADHVRRRHPDCTIQLVARENHALYNRMAITRLVYGRSAMDGLYLMPQAWYGDRNITVFLNTSARAINTARREVQLADGETLAYDRLVLATGSDSSVPPVLGWGAPGCFVLRTADDAMDVRAYAQHSAAQHAVVAGGGLLGLEAAYALHKLGLKVTVLERNKWLLHRQLDQRGGSLLQSYLQSLGMQLRLVSQIVKLAPDGEGHRAVHLADGERLAADIFIMAAGITPNTALAKAAGIIVNSGVVVDSRMATSADAVYAVGDVAEFDFAVKGLWPVAVEQAEVAARNLLGEKVIYREPVLSTVLKVVGIDVFSVGQYDAQDGDDVVLEENLPEYRYRKLVLRDGCLLGGILIGWPSLIEVLSKAAKSQQDLGAAVANLKLGDWSHFDRQSKDRNGH